MRTAKVQDGALGVGSEAHEGRNLDTETEARETECSSRQEWPALLSTVRGPMSGQGKGDKTLTTLTTRGPLLGQLVGLTSVVPGEC